MRFGLRYQGMRKATRDDLPGIAELLAPLEQRGILKPRSREQLKAELPHYTVIDLEVPPAAHWSHVLAPAQGPDQLLRSFLHHLVAQITSHKSVRTDHGWQQIAGVGVLQGQLLGCALLAPLDTAPDGARCAEIAAFCVAPEFRGTGRGDTLLEYLGACALWDLGLLVQSVYTLISAGTLLVFAGDHIEKVLPMF